MANWSGVPIAAAAVGAAAVLLSWALTPWAIRAARRFGFLDRPRGRKAHGAAVPQLGGPVIFLATWLPLGLCLLVVEAFVGIEALRVRELGLTWAAGTLLLLVGLADDRFHVRWHAKLAVQVVAACALVAGGVRFGALHVPGWVTVEIPAWGAVLSVIWLVGVTNAINLVDGVDGLATGAGLLIAATNAAICLVLGHPTVLLVNVALAGACAGFLRYNYNPARIFLGDSGSLFIGMTLAALSVVGSTKSVLTGSMLVPLVLFGYPTFDTMLVMLQRKLRGRSVFAPDRSHLHHLLLACGLNHQQVALRLYGFCTLFCALAIGLVLESEAVVVVALVASAAFFAYGIRRVRFWENFDRARISADRREFLRAHCRHRLAQLDVQASEDRAELIEMLRDGLAPFGVCEGGMVVRQRGADAGNRWARIPLRFGAEACSGDVEKSRRWFRFPGAEMTIRLGFRHTADLPRSIAHEHEGFAQRLLEVFVKRWRQLAAADQGDPAGSAAADDLSDQGNLAPEETDAEPAWPGNRAPYRRRERTGAATSGR